MYVCCRLILSETCHLDETASPHVPLLYNHSVYSEIESDTMFAYKLDKSKMKTSNNSDAHLL